MTSARGAGHPHRGERHRLDRPAPRSGAHRSQHRPARATPWSRSAIPRKEPAPDAGDEADEYPDVWGLRGAYLRDLTSRALIEPAAWDVRFARLAAVCATARVIAVETGGGVDMRDRATGAVDHVAGAVLDPLGARLAIPDDRGWVLRALPG